MLLIRVFKSSWSDEIIKLQRANHLSNWHRRAQFRACTWVTSTSLQSRIRYRFQCVLLFPVDRDTSTICFADFPSEFLFQTNHEVHWNAPREDMCGVMQPRSQGRFPPPSQGNGPGNEVGRHDFLRITWQPYSQGSLSRGGPWERGWLRDVWKLIALFVCHILSHFAIFDHISYSVKYVTINRMCRSITTF